MVLLRRDQSQRRFVRRDLPRRLPAQQPQRQFQTRPLTFQESNRQLFLMRMENELMFIPRSDNAQVFLFGGSNLQEGRSETFNQAMSRTFNVVSQTLF